MAEHIAKNVTCGQIFNRENFPLTSTINVSVVSSSTGKAWREYASNTPDVGISFLPNPTGPFRYGHRRVFLFLFFFTSISCYVIRKMQLDFSYFLALTMTIARWYWEKKTLPEQSLIVVWWLYDNQYRQDALLLTSCYCKTISCR